MDTYALALDRKAALTAPAFNSIAFIFKSILIDLANTHTAAVNQIANVVVQNANVNLLEAIFMHSVDRR